MNRTRAGNEGIAMAVAIERPYAEQEQLRRLRGSRALATGLLAVSARFSSPPCWCRGRATRCCCCAPWPRRRWSAASPIGSPSPRCSAVRSACRSRTPRSCRPTRTASARGWRGFSTAFSLGGTAASRTAGIAPRRPLRGLARAAPQCRGARGEIAAALPHFLRAVDDRQIRAFLGRAWGRSCAARDWRRCSVN